MISSSSTETLEFSRAAALSVGSPPLLPCRYLYTPRGGRLFERITETPEYYLTRTELSFADSRSEALAQSRGRTLCSWARGMRLKTGGSLPAYPEPLGRRVATCPSTVSGDCAAEARAAAATLPWPVHVRSRQSYETCVSAFFRAPRPCCCWSRQHDRQPQSDRGDVFWEQRAPARYSFRRFHAAGRRPREGSATIVAPTTIRRLFCSPSPEHLRAPEPRAGERNRLTASITSGVSPRVASRRDLRPQDGRQEVRLARWADRSRLEAESVVHDWIHPQYEPPTA